MKAVQKLEIENPGTILSTTTTNRAFINNEKRPSVMMVIGKVTNFTKGLIDIFITPKTIATTKAPKKVTETPGMR